jgi:hypothetical protein
MAFFVASYNDAGFAGASSAKRAKPSKGLKLPALVGGGVFAGVCAVTAFVSLHTMASASHGVQRFETRLVARIEAVEHSVALAEERNVRIRKFSRLSEQGRGNQKATRVAHAIEAKAFAERFGPAVADAKGQATVTELAALRPSAIVDTALGRSRDPALAEAEQHPAFEVALAAPQSAADEIDLLPDTVPLPSFRPEMAKAAEVEPSPRPAVASVPVPAPAAAPVPAAPQPSVLAFARPDNPLRETTRSSSVPWPDRGNGTAIYDISAGVVHMPSGEKLEAHSGIGKMRDNPDFVHVKMRGATPPSSYKLTMRESLFHGVEAIRLTPESGIKPHGRDGLLAHTYMLARRGESNGCVVFKDYSKFLAAFKRGEVKRIVVVPKLNGKASMTAENVGDDKPRRTVSDYFRRGA